MTDSCPSCGGTLHVTEGTFEFMKQCEKCLVRYAFSDVDVQPRRLGRGWLYLLIWVGVGLLWYLGGLWAGGNW